LKETVSTEPDGVPRHPGTPSGALRPFGLYKGSGLGLMCELLGGALTGSYQSVVWKKRAAYPLIDQNRREHSQST